MAVLGKDKRSSIPMESSTRVIADVGGLRVDDKILFGVIELRYCYSA